MLLAPERAGDRRDVLGRCAATAADDAGSSVGVAADVFGECFWVGFVDDGVADEPRCAGIRLHPER
jgi:hypothetical protein